MSEIRFLSGHNELENTWLIGDTYISGIIRPFPNVNTITQIGSNQSPFSSIHGSDIYNLSGLIKINDVVSTAPVMINKSAGVADIHLSIDDTLQITPDGKLSIVPKILMQSDLEMKATGPI